MTPAAAATLALLLTAQTPGRSPYSRIAVEHCDDDCQLSPVCAEEQLYCRPPRWSPIHRKFFRYETWAEGVVRYGLIADVMAAATGAAERSDPLWQGQGRTLSLLLVTIANHESGLRRDVHDGSTRGDCDFRMVRGQPKIIEGSCRSTCLGQIKLQRGQRTTRGYSADDLVGLGRAATMRCVQTMVDRLSQARRVCTAQRGPIGQHAACTMGVYGGVASWSGDARIALRMKNYRDLRRSEATLSERVHEALAHQTSGLPAKK
jgi:hypothetical protein